MKSTLVKRAAFGTLFLVLLGAAYGYYLFTLKPPSAADLQTDFSFKATELIRLFEQDADSIDQALLNKVVEVSGEATKVQSQESDKIVEFDPKRNYIINVVLDSTSAKPTENKNVKLKGKYVGFMEEDKDFGLPGEIKLNAAVVLE